MHSHSSYNNSNNGKRFKTEQFGDGIGYFLQDQELTKAFQQCLKTPFVNLPEKFHHFTGALPVALTRKNLHRLRYVAPVRSSDADHPAFRLPHGRSSRPRNYVPPEVLAARIGMSSNSFGNFGLNASSIMGSDNIGGGSIANDYFVARKSDGIRYQMMFHYRDQGRNLDFHQTMFTRRLEPIMVKFSTPDFIGNGTILDGELVEERDLNHPTGKRKVYYVFDVLMVDGFSTVKYRFSDRLAIIQHLVKFIKPCPYSNESPFTIRSKRFMPVRNLMQFLKDENLLYLTDIDADDVVSIETDKSNSGEESKDEKSLTESLQLQLSELSTSLAFLSSFIPSATSAMSKTSDMPTSTLSEPQQVATEETKESPSSSSSDSLSTALIVVEATKVEKVEKSLIVREMIDVHPCDGLFLIDPNEEVQVGTAVRQMKWKKPKLCTNDFLLKFTSNLAVCEFFCQDYGGLRLYAVQKTQDTLDNISITLNGGTSSSAVDNGNGGNGGNHILFGREGGYLTYTAPVGSLAAAILDTDTSKPLIVECRFDKPTKQWKPKLIRHDKITPNFIDTVKDTEQTIRDNITIQDIIDAVEGRSSY